MAEIISLEERRRNSGRGESHGAWVALIAWKLHMSDFPDDAETRAENIREIVLRVGVRTALHAANMAVLKRRTSEGRYRYFCARIARQSEASA